MKSFSFVSILCVLTPLFSCPTRAPARAALHCSRGDFTAQLTSDVSGRLEPLGLEWYKDAYVCEVGGYFIAFPADPNRGALQVRRAHESLVFRSGADNLLLGDGPYLQVFLSDGHHTGHFDAIEYSTWMPKGHYMSVTDQNLDGQPDLRTTASPTGSAVHEAWVQGNWKRYFIKDGFRLVDQPTMRLHREKDGTFTIVKDAKH